MLPARSCANFYQYFETPKVEPKPKPAPAIQPKSPIFVPTPKPKPTPTPPKENVKEKEEQEDEKEYEEFTGGWNARSEFGPGYIAPVLTATPPQKTEMSTWTNLNAVPSGKASCSNE